MKNKKENVSPNSIEYIVYSNPDPVRKLIYDCGYEPPKKLHHLASATKELVQKKGKTIITELLEVHPDKKAIQALPMERKKKKACNACNNDSYNDVDNFCGSCGHSNYSGSGDEDSFLDQFSDMSDKMLEKYYKRIVKKSNADPDDSKLANEVQMIWNELRQRRAVPSEDPPKAPTEEHPKTKGLQREEMILMGLSFLGGFVMCSVLKN